MSRSKKPALIASMEEDEAALDKLIADETNQTEEDHESGKQFEGNDGAGGAGEDEQTLEESDNGDGDKDAGQNTGKTTSGAEGDAEASEVGSKTGDGGANGGGTRSSTTDGGETGEAPRTNQDWARIRKQVAEKEAVREAARLAALKPIEVTQPSPADDPEPNKADNYEGWLEWANRQSQRKIAATEARLEAIEKQNQTQEETRRHETMRSGALEEIKQFEQTFAPTVSNYKDVVLNGFGIEVKRFLASNPTKTEKDIVKFVEDTALQLGARFHAADINPAEGIYNYFLNAYGAPAPQAAPREEVKQKTPDLKRIDSLKRRSASPMKGGQNSGVVAKTKEAAADASLSELASYTADDWRELEETGT